MASNVMSCDYCGAEFTDLPELLDHEEAHRVAGNEQLANPTCVLSPVQEVAQCSNSFMKELTCFPCDQCDKTFVNKKSLVRHAKSKHSGITYPCNICGKAFGFIGHRSRHEKSCKLGFKAFDCNVCGKRCATVGGLLRHQEVHQGSKPANINKRKKKEHVSNSLLHQNPKTTPLKRAPKRTATRRVSAPFKKKRRTLLKQFRCRRCTEVFDNRYNLWAHGMRQHYQVGAGLQPVPWGRHPAPWDQEDGNVDADLREVYETNEPIILARDEPGPIVSSYNFPIDNRVGIQQLNRFALDVYEREQHTFRLNLAFGVILQNRETQQYRYCTPYANSMVLESPIYISRRRDLRKLHLRLRRLDVLTELLRQRPDTKWIPVLVTNVIIRTYSTQYPLGMGQLPNYVTNHHAIVPLVKNKQRQQPYTDQLCAFRCLALHRGYDVEFRESDPRVVSPMDQG